MLSVWNVTLQDTACHGVVTRYSNRSYTGFEPEFPASQVCLGTPWATGQTNYLWKPIWSWIGVMLTFKSISFQISQHINLVLKS